MDKQLPLRYILEKYIFLLTTVFAMLRLSDFHWKTEKEESIDTEGDLGICL